MAMLNKNLGRSSWFVLVLLLGWLPAIVAAEALSGDEGCECPSIEDQLQERIYGYKAEIEKQFKALEDQFSEELSEERIDALREQVEQWLELFRKEFVPEEVPPTKQIGV